MAMPARKNSEPTLVDMFHIVNTVVASHLSSDHMVLSEFANVARRWEGRRWEGPPLVRPLGKPPRAGSTTPLRQQHAGAEDPSEAAAAAPPIIKKRRIGKGPDRWGVWRTALGNKPPSSSHELPLWTSTLSRDSHEGRCS